jgi:hypothetical protein
MEGRSQGAFVGCALKPEGTGGVGQGVRVVVQVMVLVQMQMPA